MSNLLYLIIYSFVLLFRHLEMQTVWRSHRARCCDRQIFPLQMLGPACLVIGPYFHIWYQIPRRHCRNSRIYSKVFKFILLCFLYLLLKVVRLLTQGYHYIHEFGTLLVKWSHFHFYEKNQWYIAYDVYFVWYFSWKKSDLRPPSLILLRDNLRHIALSFLSIGIYL